MSGSGLGGSEDDVMRQKRKLAIRVRVHQSCAAKFRPEEKIKKHGTHNSSVAFSKVIRYVGFRA